MGEYTPFEALGNVARQLQMLFLVNANGHKVRLIQKDIRRHQNGVGKQAAVDILGVLGAFLFELMHARQVSKGAKTTQHPRELCVCGHMALHKHYAFFGVDAAGQQKGRRLARLAAQGRGVLPHGDGVFVHHGIDAFIFVLQLGPVAHRPHIIAPG